MTLTLALLQARIDEMEEELARAEAEADEEAKAAAEREEELAAKRAEAANALLMENFDLSMYV